MFKNMLTLKAYCENKNKKLQESTMNFFFSNGFSIVYRLKKKSTNAHMKKLKKKKVSRGV